ncbi:hypothetical protein C1645_734277 [Glomus cerebriforme]|uniref:Galactose oxidase n=1 Tax=Glomus cerebriforme TaxID=658196 RepID=A0A397TFH4_9GLOM|nr:hypothetical protein C1645_734277 [Glomus cerebriforme]
MKKFTFFFIALLCLLQIKIEVNAQLTPSYRKLHSAIFIEKKLYIFGGIMNYVDPILLTDPNNVFFYLDMSTPFDTSNLPWKIPPNNIENLPLESLSSTDTGGVAASVGGINNNTIVFINNEKDNVTNSISPVHFFDPENNLWNTQNISGDRPIGRNQMRTVTDYNGKIYLLTGFDFTVQGVTRSNGLIIFDTINLNCEIKDAPVSRLGYGATFLPNGIIVYMAGWDRNYNIAPNNFNEIYLYDTNNDKWDIKITAGSIPHGDAGITSVLGLDGNRIIVFGGDNDNNNNLYVLDLKNYEWYIPKVTGQSPGFKRGEHTANVIGKYMVIAFGKYLIFFFNKIILILYLNIIKILFLGSNGITQDKYRSSGESDILLLDISNDSEYVWTTSFDPASLTINSPSPTYSPSTPPKNITSNVIIGLIISLVIVVGILLIIAFFLIRKYKNTNKAIPTPGNIKSEMIVSIPSEYELSHEKSRVY